MVASAVSGSTPLTYCSSIEIKHADQNRIWLKKSHSKRKENWCCIDWVEVLKGKGIQEGRFMLWLQKKVKTLIRCKITIKDLQQFSKKKTNLLEKQ